MSSSQAREHALQILQRVQTQNAFATHLLDQVSHNPAISDHERALIHQLVKGTLVWRGRIDGILERFVARGTRELTPWILNILRMGAYQILFLDRTPPEVAVSESVNLARRYGHQGTASLVNAVLRRVAREAASLRAAEGGESVAEIASSYSYPPWLVARWVAQIGAEETVALCQAQNIAWPTSVRTNTLRVTTAELRLQLDAAGVRWQPAPFHAESTLITQLPEHVRLHELASFEAGLFQVQDASFALIGQLVDPQPGELVVDLCSAPGGKTTHLAELMQNQGQIIAADLHERRLALVRESCERLGVTIVETRAGDGRALQLDRLADRVLVDAPCSGTGVLGRRSDARWNKAEGDVSRLSRLQQELLDHAATLVRPGGRLVYVTCTLEAEENEAVVTAFLERNPSFAPLDLAGLLPPELISAEGYYRAWPHRHAIGGAFGAALVNRTG
jgi:16S rRNA (cytosine967-C5)-methyltransferase